VVYCKYPDGPTVVPTTDAGGIAGGVIAGVIIGSIIFGGFNSGNTYVSEGESPD
jgi:hypothetical protein